MGLLDDKVWPPDWAASNKSIKTLPYISLEVPSGFSAETACMNALESVLGQMLANDLEARARVACWLCDKYGLGEKQTGTRDY